MIQPIKFILIKIIIFKNFVISQLIINKLKYISIEKPLRNEKN